MFRAYRFQLRCKPAQERALRRVAGGLRWVWNRALAEQKARYARGEKFASYVDMAKWLTAWRNAPETAWLAEGPIHPQQQALKRLEEAFKRFFAKAGGYPSFKRRGQEPGIRFPDPKQFALDQENARAKLPKLGWMRLRQSQPVAGELRNVSLRKEGEKWFCSFLVEQADVLPAAGLQPSLGLDLGVALFAAGSDGKQVQPLAALKKQQQRLRRYQKSVSRKVKGSANRKKAVKRLGNLHGRIAHQRADWLHKLSTELADQHPVIAIEKLNVKAMTASAAGTTEKPGKNVKAKSGLNRSILDAGWGKFALQLDYKLQARGGTLIKVPAAYTSQACSACGHTEKLNRSSQARFKCVACGHAENADVNAAKNILARALAQGDSTNTTAGHAVWAGRNLEPAACGEAVSRRRIFKSSGAASKKQEPTEAWSSP